MAGAELKLLVHLLVLLRWLIDEELKKVPQISDQGMTVADMMKVVL